MTACPFCRHAFEPAGDAASVACPSCRMEFPRESARTETLGTDAAQLSPPTLSDPDAAPRPLTVVPGQTLAPGSLIGQYRVESPLGRGGMGAVYRAIHLHLQRPVALKVLPPELAKDPEFVKRFKREAQALARLQHPHIVAVHDMGIQGELYYFAMELVDGVNLRQALGTKKLTPEQALSLVPKLCEALEYAHAHGVVHRDIKPENILLDKSGAPKIADFGLAKIVKGESGVLALTQTNVVMGTADYMAPEQREATAKVDHRADIYALGVVVYEMLTGQLPMGRFDPPSRKVQVDVRIDDVVLKALAANPEQRYQRASHMGGDVTHVIATPAGVPAEAAAPAAGSAAPRPGLWGRWLAFYRQLPLPVQNDIGKFAIVMAGLTVLFFFLGIEEVLPWIAIPWGIALGIKVWNHWPKGGKVAPAPPPVAHPVAIPVVPAPPPKAQGPGCLAMLAYGAFVGFALLAAVGFGALLVVDLNAAAVSIPFDPRAPVVSIFHQIQAISSPLLVGAGGIVFALGTLWAIRRRASAVLAFLTAILAVAVGAAALMHHRQMGRRTTALESIVDEIQGRGVKWGDRRLIGHDRAFVQVFGGDLGRPGSAYVRFRYRTGRWEPDGIWTHGGGFSPASQAVDSLRAIFEATPTPPAAPAPPNPDGR